MYFREEGKKDKKKAKKDWGRQKKTPEKLRRKEEKWEKVWYKKRGRDKWEIKRLI